MPHPFQACAFARPQFLRVLRPGKGEQAALRLVEYRGTLAVLKDYSDSGAVFRRTCGAYLARREAAAYRRLAGVRGVPRLLGHAGRDGLLLEYCPGWNCREGQHSAVTPAFFDELRDILAVVRAAGVLHLDVKRNVLVAQDEHPVLIDFGASWVIPRWLGPLRSVLLPIAAKYDEREVVKLKSLIAPQLLTEKEQVTLATALPMEKLVSFVETLLQKTVSGISRVLWLRRKPKE
jgi:hypothetical protein